MFLWHIVDFWKNGGTKPKNFFFIYTSEIYFKEVSRRAEFIENVYFDKKRTPLGFLDVKIS